MNKLGIHQLGLIGIFGATVLNLAAVLFKLNYIASVMLVMGGMSAFYLYYCSKLFDKKLWISLLVFLCFSNLLTTPIEKLMIVLDIWGFSNDNFRLIGVNFWGAPVEEYVYWWMSPVVVGSQYMALALMHRFVSLEASNGRFYLWLLGLSKIASETIQKYANDSNIDYVENDPKATKQEYGTYKRGKKAPAWIYVQLAIIVTILALMRFYRGRWAALWWTTATFVAVGYGNELYALHQGFWVYNANRLLGPFVLGVPVEEWIMYVASSICGCMIINIGNRKFLKINL